MKRKKQRELIGKETKKNFNTKVNGKDIKLYPLGTPKNSHFKNVRSEFEKHEWDKIRKMSYRNAKYKCEICGQTGNQQGYKHPVECHEIWDYNWDTKEQKLIGFISLCPRCHKIVHYSLTTMLYEKGNISHGEYLAINKHFKDVNNINCSVESVIGINLKFHRNKHDYEWDINIDYAHNILETLDIHQ